MDGKDMRRSKDVARGSNKELLSDAISRIFSERASFELRDDDVEALRQQLRLNQISPPHKRSESHTQDKEVEEAARWKVISPP